MPNPLRSDLHVDAPLTNMAIGYWINNTVRNVSNPLHTPFIPTDKQSNVYPVYNKADLLRRQMRRHEAPAGYQFGGYGVSTEQFNCLKNQLNGLVTDENKAANDYGLSATEAEIAFLMTQNVLDLEHRWATKLFATGLWATERVGVAAGPTGTQFLRWDAAGSTPVTDMKDMIESVADLHGYRPNRAYCNSRVLNTISNNSETQDRLKANGNGEGARSAFTANALAEMIGVDEVCVSDVVENTANVGAAASMSKMLGNHFLLAHVTRVPRLKIPTAFATFAFNGLTGLENGKGMRIKSVYNDEFEGDVLTGSTYVDTKLTGSDLGGFLLDVIS